MDIQNNSIVTDADTDVLDSQITQISNDFAETYYFDNEQQEELEMLVAKCMKLGELYERKKWQAAKAQAVPEGFVLVPKAGAQYFSHDFNGDGFKYHDTLDEAKKEAEANLDWYRDQVADGRHVNDMGEFNELSYGLVIGSAEYSIDHVVTQDDIDKGESKYEVGTEILSLYLSEAQDQTND